MTPRALVTVLGLVTAWRVVSLVRGGELREVPDVLSAAVIVAVLLLTASVIRTFGLQR